MNSLRSSIRRNASRTRSIPSTFLSILPLYITTRACAAPVSWRIIAFQSSSISMPPISLRGTIMSSTVTFSISKIESNMSWCSVGMNLPASSTTPLSSSALNPCDSFLRICNNFIKPLMIRFIKNTSGSAIFFSGVRT